MCNLCYKKPVYEFTNKRKVCRQCFVKWFNKKFLYTIRKYNMISKNDIVIYSEKKDFRSVVLKKMLEFYSEKSSVELKQKKPLLKKYTKYALEDTSDLRSYLFIREMFNGDILNQEKFLPVHNKKITPLFLFLDKEVLLYARLNKFDFVLNKEQNNEISGFIDFLEKKHPEIKRAIVNSYMKFLY